MTQSAAPGAVRRRSRFFRKPSQRETFLLLALVLGLLLVALLALLARQFGMPFLEERPKAGIRVKLVIEGPGRGPNPLFARPMGVAVGQGRRIYVTDATNNRVCAFDEYGRFLFEFGGLGVSKPLPGAPMTWKPGRLNFPVGVDVDEDGNVYVADFRNDQISVFDAEGKWLRAFPEPRAVVGKGGSGQDGRGIAVTDVAVRDGRVFAVDKYQVFVFTTDGKLLGQFGKPGRGQGDLDHPNGVAVGADGTVYVSDSNHSRVIAFSEEGSVLWATGGIPSGLGDRTVREFELPRGLEVIGDNLYVADAFRSQIAVLRLDGRPEGRYGERGDLPGQLNFPNDVDALGSDFVVADKENERVQVVSLVGSGVSSGGRAGP